MSKPFEYFSKANQMSAILKRDIHALRTAHPKRLSPKNERPLFRFNKAGDAIPNGITLVQLSSPITPRARHELAWRKE